MLEEIFHSLAGGIRILIKDNIVSKEQRFQPFPHQLLLLSLLIP